MRYGTALAFAAKASLVMAVLSAFREQIWLVVGSKFLKVTTLDDMFAAPETPLSLLNWEFITAVPGEEVQNTTCPGVRTLNFRFEDQTDWRNGGKIEDLSQQSLSYWNNTSSNKSDPYFFDYYTAPSENAEEFMHAITYLQRPITDQDTTFEVCERGWNCTVEIYFVGPAYRCREVSRGGKINHTLSSIRTSVPPFSMNDLAPKGNYTYIANTLQGEYAFPQMAKMKKGGIPVMPPPYPKHLGAFRTEPVIWIGYSELNEAFTSVYLNSSEPVQNEDAFTPVLVACEHYEANYTAEIIYRDGMQLPKIKSRRFLAPVVNTTFFPGLDANDGTMDETIAVPESNYILPQDVKTYRRTAGYHSMGLFLRNKLNGTIREPGKVEETGVVQTSLIDHRFHFVRPNLIGLIEAWYGNLLMSMFARPRFQAVVWAAQINEQTGIRRTGLGPKTDYLYPCVRSRPAIRFHYRTSTLVGVYGILISLALLGAMAGAMAIRRNAGSRGTRFSDIIEATRGPELDKMSLRAYKLRLRTTSITSKTPRLGYGKLKSLMDGENGVKSSEDHTCRIGFGFQGDVEQPRDTARRGKDS
ncbi:hypothetical protein SGCOL_010036 [Colletotrichum sp. CLE4]